MPDHLGNDMRKIRTEETEEKEIKCKEKLFSNVTHHIFIINLHI